MADKIPKGWRKEKLFDEIETPITGSRPKGGVSEESGTIPSIGAEFITSDGRLNFEGMKFIDEDFYNSMKLGKLKVNDILICKDGDVGKVAFYDKKYFDKAVVNEHVFILRPKNGANPEYLFYSLLSDKAQKRFKRIMTGSVQLGINTQFTKYFNILVPPKNEQDRIVDVLSTLDEAINQTDDIIKEIEKIKQSLTQKILFNKKMPFDWKPVKIKDCCENLDNKRVPLNSEDRKKIRGGVPYYGANGVKDYIDKWIFDEDLILLAEDGGHFLEYQHRPIAYRISGKSWVNNHAHILRVKEGYDFNFIFYSLVNKNIVPFINGGTRGKLNKSELMSLTLMCPKYYKEQVKIGDSLNTMDTRIKKEELKKANLKKVKGALMQKLLTGQIRLEVS